VKSALEIAADVRGGATSALAEAQRSLDAIRARNEELNVFVHVDEASTLARALEVDEQVARGEDPGPLAGVPVALKDNLCETGELTTAGSRILEGWRPPYSATVVKLILRAGAVPMGKTNMDEFAMGSSTENSYYGPTRNPLDPSRVLLRRISGRRCRQHDPARPGLRYRWVDTSTSRALWRGRGEADLRSGLALRTHCLR
jgi:aspartyl-tRNA(Asn)/glutamyl-tRNA(Gln) amidotransferase subunit A